MKENKKAFSLTELIVGVILLMIAGVSMYSSYSFLHKKDEIVEKSLLSIYYHKYIFNIASEIDFPDTLQIGNTFYLTKNGGNNISLSNNPNDNTNPAGFISEFENIPTKHSIEVFSRNEIESILYTTYKITTEYYDYEQISYLTK